MIKSAVKYRRSTAALQLKLVVLRVQEACGIHGVAVKCIDIMKNPDCESSMLGHI
jgi:hypothetical protein